MVCFCSFTASFSFTYRVATASYKPVLEEVEKILAEAGLDEEEMKKGAVAAGPGGAGQSRNRR